MFHCLELGHMASLAAGNLRGEEFSFAVSLVKRQRRMWWEWVCISQSTLVKAPSWCSYQLRGLISDDQLSQFVCNREPSRMQGFPCSNLDSLISFQSKNLVPFTASFDWVIILKTIVCYLRIYMLNPMLLAWLVTHRWGWSFTESLLSQQASCLGSSLDLESSLDARPVTWDGMGLETGSERTFSLLPAPWPEAETWAVGIRILLCTSLRARSPVPSSRLPLLTPLPFLNRDSS